MNLEKMPSSRIGKPCLFLLLFALSTQLIHGQQEKEAVKPISYLSQRPIKMTLTTITETDSDAPLEYKAFEAPNLHIVFSSIENYIWKDLLDPSSASLKRKLSEAKMEFWLQPSKWVYDDLTPLQVQQHFAYIQSTLPPNTEFEALLIPNPEERIFDRYFQQKPFELAYSFTTLDAAGKKQTTIVHENWVPRDGHFLAARLISPEATYPGLLKEARRIWKDGSFIPR